MERLKSLPAFLVLLLLAACAAPQANSVPPVEISTPLPTPDPLHISTGGGDPRSPGYWLLWNACAEGNQAETARANGGREAGWFIMDDLLVDPGILVGVIVVETCEQGVNLLQARDIQGAEMKNDAAYALAAQQLTAQLNMAVGSETCPASDQAVSEAQLLLLELNFDGRGAYLGPPLASSNVDKAQTLAEQLASYNSGNLCR